MSKFSKQKGAAMIEVAYVLPFFIMMLLVFAEFVDYSMQRLALNDVVNKIYQQQITPESQQGSGSSFASASGILACNVDKVVFSSNAASVIQSRVYELYKAKFPTTSLKQSDIVVNSPSVIAGASVTTYLVEVSYPFNLLVLAEVASVFSDFKVSDKSIYTFAGSCKP